MNRKFIVSWDSTGLEACVDITDKLSRSENFEKEKIFDLLKNPNVKPVNETQRDLNNLIHGMMLRAKFNPQRNYEIYILTATEGIEREDIVGWFEASPQAAADRTREIGQKLYSDRRTQQAVIVWTNELKNF